MHPRLCSSRESISCAFLVGGYRRKGKPPISASRSSLVPVTFLFILVGFCMGDSGVSSLCSSRPFRVHLRQQPAPRTSLNGCRPGSQETTLTSVCGAAVPAILSRARCVLHREHSFLFRVFGEIFKTRKMMSPFTGGVAAPAESHLPR